jgi:hypothetical protein
LDFIVLSSQPLILQAIVVLPMNFFDFSFLMFCIFCVLFYVSTHADRKNHFDYDGSHLGKTIKITAAYLCGVVFLTWIAVTLIKFLPK